MGTRGKSGTGQFETGSAVSSIVYLDRPRRLVTHRKDAVLLYNVESGELEKKVDLVGGNAIRRLAADQARSRLVVGFGSGAIARLSLPDLTPLSRLEDAHHGNVDCVALSPDGRLLATGAADRRVVLRDAMSFETLLEFPLWTGTLRDLTFDSTGRRLAIVGTNCDVDLWDPAALSDGLADLGLAWDRPAPVPAVDSSSSSGPVPVGEHVRPTIPVIRRPGPTALAAPEGGR
jgi:WD40 repeat protein